MSRLSKDAHTARPWRIHEIAYDFRIEDVWALPTPGGPDDFEQLVKMFTSRDRSRPGPLPVRVLVAIREKLGAVFGWDEQDEEAPTLRDRVPPDLRETQPAAFANLPFEPLYLVEDEFAAELANRTMHGILHLGWIRDEAGGYHGQMAVLVKPNGLLGRLYMAAIKPFRHLIVYPALMRGWERAWRRRRSRTRDVAPSAPTASSS